MSPLWRAGASESCASSCESSAFVAHRPCNRHRESVMQNLRLFSVCFFSSGGGRPGFTGAVKCLSALKGRLAHMVRSKLLVSVLMINRSSSARVKG